MRVPPSAVFKLLLRSLTVRIAPPRRPRPGAAPAQLCLRGLQGEAWICRDAYGIPRIYAAHEPDAFFALGFAMLQDRWWQMDLWRRTASGRLAEIFGDLGLGQAAPSRLAPGATIAGADLTFRTIGLRRLAEEDLKAHNPQGLELLRAFAAGANAAREAALAAGRYPPECVLLRYVPEPWTEVDSLCSARLIAWMLSLSLPCHLAIGRLKAHPHLRQVLPSYPEDGPCVLDGGACSWEAGLGLLALAAAAREPFGAGPGTGSNSWAAAPARTATGGALLANDPHLPLRLPSVWYQFTLECPGLGLAGLTMPGIPGALVGQNGRVAWGLTNTMLDDADVYVETVDPADPDRYLGPAGPRPFHVLEEATAVRGEPAPRRHRIRFTEHGGVRCPVVSDAVPAARDGRVLALRWTGLDAWPVVDVVRRANRARTVADLDEALRDYNVPAQNFVGADADGRITYLCGGRIPRRPLPVTGGPLDGASGRHEWLGVLPFEENPRAGDPPSGFLVTANHRVSPLPLFPEPPYRAARIRERLRAEARHTADTFAAIQGDVVSLQARALVEGVLGSLRGRLRDPRARAAAERLLAWDGAMRADAPEPAIFHAWYAQLLRQIIRPPLEAADPGLFEFYISLFHLAVCAADAIFLGVDPAWYPEGKGPAVEAALLAALEELEAAQGPDPAAWRWGRAHPLTLAHTLGAVGHPLARALARWLRLNRGPYPHPGDGMTVNLAGYPLNAPYRPQVGPSLRLIADLKDPGASRWVIPGGTSGDPFSPHYADQLELWRRGEYLPMRVLSLEEARRTGTALRLVPA